MANVIKYVADLINKFDLTSEKSKDDAIYNKGKQDYERIKRELDFVLPQFREDILEELDENGKLVYQRFKQTLDPIIKHKKKI